MLNEFLRGSVIVTIAGPRDVIASARALECNSVMPSVGATALVVRGDCAEIAMNERRSASSAALQAVARALMSV
jgi:hypothetical protein